MSLLMSRFRLASREFHSEPSNQARLYYQNGNVGGAAAASGNTTMMQAREKDRMKREQRLQRDLQQTQEKILANYQSSSGCGGGGGGGGEVKENFPLSPTAARRNRFSNGFSSPLASDYSDLAPDTLSLRAPDHIGGGHRNTRASRCIIAGCSFEPIGGRGFCTLHASTQSSEAASTPIRVITKQTHSANSSVDTNNHYRMRAASPTRLASAAGVGHFHTATLGVTSPMQSSVAAAAIGVMGGMFPALTHGSTNKSTPIIQAQYRDTSVEDVASFLAAGSISTSAHPAGVLPPAQASSSIVGGSPLKLSSSRLSGPLLQYSSEETNGAGSKIITPRRTSGKLLQPTPPTPATPASPSAAAAAASSQCQSPMPMRALRTPAGLALSYEHGRNVQGLRKEVLYKSNGRDLSSDFNNGSISSAGVGVASTNVATLPSSLYQTATAMQPLHLTAALNRVATPQAQANMQRVASPSNKTRAGAPPQLLPLTSPSSATATNTNGDAQPPVHLRSDVPLASSSNVVGAIPLPPSSPSSSSSLLLNHSSHRPYHHEPPSSIGFNGVERSLTAVQRQRAYRAALLSKVLSKPSSVQTLDRTRMDALKDLLDKRSSSQSLIKRKVLLTDEDRSQEHLRKAGRRTNLESLLAHRPSVLALTSKNILHDESDSAKLTKIKGELGSFLQTRPTMGEVEKKFKANRTAAAILGHIDIQEENENENDNDDDSKEDDLKEDADDADVGESGDVISPIAVASADRFRKFPGVLKNAAPIRRASTILAPGQRKFSVFTSAKMATTAEKTLNKLSAFLENRPHFEELMKKNIMMTRPGTSFHSNPSLAANARKMSFSNLRNNVSKLLSTRPTMKDLKSMAKNLLGTIVSGQMQQIRENEAEADAAAAELAAATSNGDGSHTDAPSISLESLASDDNLRIDEIMSQKRRITELKLRARAKEEEESGGIYMMGANQHGQTGFSGQFEFISTLSCLKPLLREVIEQVACGYEHTLVRTNTGMCFSYGKNTYGQCGLGDAQDRDQPYSIHFRGSPIFKKLVKWIAASEKASAIVTKDDEVFTMGSIATGSLGHGDPENEDPNVAPLFAALPTSVVELRNRRVEKVSLGGSHGAAIDTAGRMYTWGRNDQGQLGNGDLIARYRPALIQNHGEFWSEVACGEAHTAAIGFDNNVHMWGSNRNGQLGFQNLPDWNSCQSSPKVVMSLFRKGVHKLSCSRHHTVALTEDGDAYSTLIIDHARFIDRCKFHRLKPTLHIKDIVATPIDHTIAIDLQGNTYTWEPNQFDEPKVDDALETRHLHEIAAGLEHAAIIGTIDKKWRDEAIENAEKAKK